MEGDVPHRKIVFIDTNIYREDLLQVGQRFQALLHFLQASGSTLVIPEVVSREVKKKYRDKVTQDQTAIARLSRTYPSYFSKPFDVDALVKEFEHQWDARVASSGFIEEVGVPTDLDVSSLLDRSLSELPPFGLKSKGFRDAVIWETILSDIRTRYEQVTRCFITANTDDFGKGQLKSELQEEVLGHDVRYYNNLEDFLADNQIDLPFLNLANAQRWVAREESSLKALVDPHDAEDLLNLEEFTDDLDDILPAGTYDEINAISLKYAGYKVHHPYIFREDEFNYFVRIEVDVLAKVRLRFDYETEDKQGELVFKNGTASRVISYDAASFEYKINKRSHRRLDFFEDY